MKKRLLSLLVAISMVLTFLPVSALTAAAAEDSSSGELKIGQDCYPVLDHIPHQTVNGHDIYTGDGWTYDADENCKILTLCPSAPTNYDFFAIHTGHSITTDCNLVIGENATVTDGNFIASVTNNGTVKGGIFKGAVTNHGTIIGGRFFTSVTNESDGIIENGQFGDWASSYTVTNNGGRINGGTFKDKSSISGTSPVALGYTLTAETPSDFIDVSVNGYRNSCYIIPNQTYPASVRIVYVFDHTLPPLDVTIDSVQHMLLSDWCGSNFKIEFEDIRGVYEVTFTAPPANGSTVTISPLTRLVIDKDGYPAVAQDRDGNRANYTGDGWKFENDTLTLEPAAKTNYDFNSPELNPHRAAVNCPVTVDSNATITNGIFLKEVTGSASALNGVFLNVPNGCENSIKKITVSDNGTITALKTSGDTTTLDSAAKEIYVVGQPTGTLYVTLSSGKVREVQLPLTADLELQLNDPKPEPKPEPEPEPKPEPKPEPEPETYTLKVVGGSFTTGERDALTSGTVPVDAEAKVTLNPDAVPEGMVFDQWTISEESLLGNPNVAYNAESFTIPANAVEKGKTVTVEAQYREASIEDDGPGILGTAAIIGTAGAGAAVLGYTGYMIGTELYLNTVLPAGAAIPNNAGELALLLWEAAGTPAPAALLPADAAPVQQALAWAIENQLLAPDASAEDSVSRWEVIRSWGKINA